MPRSALPEHLNSKAEIDAAFPDDSQLGTGWFGRLWRWYKKKTKTWFCFSYRCTEWWARWRKYPRVLFAVRGKGYWRFETETRDYVTESLTVFEDNGWKDQYLSRIQYWCRWHIAIQWPLMISWHFYQKAEDVPLPYPSRQRPDLDGKLWYFYWNHFDADLVYWMVTSMFIGRNWK